MAVEYKQLYNDPDGLDKVYPVLSEGNITAENLSCVVVTTTSFSSLPQTFTDSKINSNHVVINSVLSNPTAQVGDWVVTTANGSLTISGSISGTTTVTLYLLEQR